MGFFSGMKQAGSYFFNFKVTKWIAADEIKRTSTQIFETARNTYTPQQAEHLETFEEALKRLNLTEEQLMQRLSEFTKLLIIYLLTACAVFAYGIFIVIVYKNLMGFFMCLGLTVFALSNAFRYHFWIYQIKSKKLGCTLREWFSDKH